MFEFVVNSNLSCHLMFNFFLPHHLFTYYLQRTQKISLLMSMLMINYIESHTVPNFPFPN